MLKTIIKRDGRTEAFDPVKVNHWSQWASKDLQDRVDWSMIVMRTIKSLSDTVSSQELQKQLIKNCIQENNWAYSVMAGRLYTAIMRKELFDDYIPTVKELHQKLADYGLMRVLNYTDEDYQAIQGMIDHSRDFNMAYFQINQIRKKYSLTDRSNKKEFESPQFVYMRMAMALAEDEPLDQRLIHVKNWYDHFSLNRLNAPTPNYLNLGTDHNGYASCCLFTVDDTAQSIGVGEHIAYTMTYMSAGIGGTLHIRSIGDPVRAGSIEHQGKLAYYHHLGGAVHANLQGGRGGACTIYYSCFDPEAETIAMLQNPRTPVDKQNREMHFGMLYNKFFARKAAKNEDIFTFNIRTCPELYEKFFSGDSIGFETCYLKYEQDPLFKKNYVSARDILITACQQSHEVATHYFLQIDEANRHTPFKEPIYSSNLCVAPETLITTDEGDVEIQSKVNQQVNIWNGEEFTEVTINKTSVKAKLLKLGFSYKDIFKTMDCTWYHKFYVKIGSSIKKLCAYELQQGMVTIPFTLPDGTYCDGFEVVYVNDTGRCDATYCFTEPKRQMGMFNGILTGNCDEITVPTKPYDHITGLYNTFDLGQGEVGLCSLAAIVVSNIKTDDVYESVAYYALKMIDKCIHLSHYELPHIGTTAKARLNAGVGITGLATVLARKGLPYNCEAGYATIHQIAERHAYYVIKASLQLGKELGNAPWIHKTKWPEGWLPIDTYNRNVDKITNPVYKYDWETLRAEIIQNQGIRNSSLIAHMPVESSSKASGAPNGLYPIRDLSLKKTDLKNALEWCATDNDILADQYQIAWELSVEDQTKVYAVIQKFTDQSISADFYTDRNKRPILETADLIREFLYMPQYGVKSKYYQNSLTSTGTTLDDVTPNEKANCGSGGCTL